MGIMGVMIVRGANRAGAAEQAVKEVGQEIRQQGGFGQLVGTAGTDEVGPVVEFWMPSRRLPRQIE
jgi:hypothetical protein